jgi:hypothetical protein
MVLRICYFFFSNIYLGFGSEVWLIMFRIMNFPDIRVYSHGEK